jgi:carnitine-CoA ligase
MREFGPLTTVFPAEHWTIPHVLEHQAREHGEAPFLQWTHQEAAVSYAQANAEANRISWGLAGLGVAKGDRVVIFMNNSLLNVFAGLACGKLGAVDAPINTSYKGQFLRHQINLCRAKLMIVDASLAPLMAPIEGDLTHLETILVAGHPKEIEDLSQLLLRLRVLSIEEVITAKTENPPPAVGPSDVATILFTSGTSGLSKGVKMPHGQVYFYSDQTVALHRLGPDDVYLTPFPLFHASGRVHGVLPALIAGGKCVLYDKFSATEFLARVHASGATATNFLGSMIPLILGQPASLRDRDHRLRTGLAAPIPYPVIDAFRQRFGIAEVLEIIGMTETCWPIMSPRGVTPPYGAAGLVVGDWYEAKVIDPQTDRELPPGQAGELAVRPKQPWIISTGYENMPEQTAEAWRNLWFHTGDGVKRDEEGWFYFVDRLKDSIRRRGENISSYEVELQVMAHPAVADAAAVAVRPDPTINDDEIKVYVVPEADQILDLADLIRWCDERLPHFAVPRFVEIVESLPKTPSGKVQKAQLRAQGLGGNTLDRVGAGILLQRDEAKAAKKQVKTIV